MDRKWIWQREKLELEIERGTLMSRDRSRNDLVQSKTEEDGGGWRRWTCDVGSKLASRGCCGSVMRVVKDDEGRVSE